MLLFITILHSRFIEQVTTAESIPKKPFSITRNTVQLKDFWRKTITAPQLKFIENICSSLISTLGHRIFKTIGDVRNMSNYLKIE